MFHCRVRNRSVYACYWTIFVVFFLNWRLISFSLFHFHILWNWKKLLIKIPILIQSVVEKSPQIFKPSLETIDYHETLLWMNFFRSSVDFGIFRNSIGIQLRSRCLPFQWHLLAPNRFQTYENWVKIDNSYPIAIALHTIDVDVHLVMVWM